MQTRQYKNTILRALDGETLARLDLRPVTFALNYEIEFPGKEVEHLFFVEEGMASITTTFKDGSQVEVGMFGYESVIGVSALMGTKRSLNRVYTQIPGSGYSCRVGDARGEFDRGGKFQILTLGNNILDTSACRVWNKRCRYRVVLLLVFYIWFVFARQANGSIAEYQPRSMAKIFVSNSGAVCPTKIVMIEEINQQVDWSRPIPVHQISPLYVGGLQSFVVLSTDCRSRPCSSWHKGFSLWNLISTTFAKDRPCLRTESYKSQRVKVEGRAISGVFESDTHIDWLSYNGFSDFLMTFRIIEGQLRSTLDIGTAIQQKKFSLQSSRFSHSLITASLPECEGCVEGNNDEGYPFQNKPYVFAGCIVFAVGLVLLYKVWWKISFDLPCNAYLAGYVALTIACMVVIGIGFSLAAWGSILVHK